MIKAVIFDMDGVLINSEPIYYETLKQYLADKNLPCNEKILKRTVGASVDTTETVLYTFFPKGTDFELFQEEVHKITFPPLDYKAIQYPGIIETLKELRNRGIKVALASASPVDVIHRVCDCLEIRSYFDSILSGEMFHESKPHPEVYLQSAKLLDVACEECLVIEDSNYGITAGKAAGMTVLAKKDDYFGIDQSQADGFIEELEDILSYLDKI